MLVFAHVGLTLAMATILARLDRNLNPSLAFVALGSLLPDLIDKPLGHLMYGSMSTGRIFAHTFLFVLVLAAFATIFRSRALGSLTGGVFAHLLEDSMWAMPITLLWPLLGPFTINQPLSILNYFEMLMRGLENPHVFVPEILGFLFLAHLAVQTRYETFERAKRIARRLSKAFEPQS